MQQPFSLKFSGRWYCSIRLTWNIMPTNPRRIRNFLPGSSSFTTTALCSTIVQPHPIPRVEKFNILFMGSDEFSITCLKSLVGLKASSPSTGAPNSVPFGQTPVIDRLRIVTPADCKRTKNSRVPLKNFSIANELEQVDFPSDPSSLSSDWRELIVPPPSSISGVHSAFNLAVVVSFGHFIPASFLRFFKYGAINVHPSLLPKYRGSSPIQHAILNDDQVSGVSIIDIHPDKFDAGRILKQTRFSIPPKSHFPQLRDALAEIGSRDLIKTIVNLAELRNASNEQSREGVTFARKIQKSRSLIDWKAQTSHELYRIHRALGFKTPLYCYFRGRRIQLLQIHDPDAHHKIPPVPCVPGALAYNDQSILFVGCSSNTWLPIVTLKIEGKQELSIADFLNGYQIQYDGSELLT